MVRNTGIDKKQIKQVVKEAEMEFKLRGKFKRVFPSIDYPYYKQFFTEERALNIVLDEKIMAKRRISNHTMFPLVMLPLQPGLNTQLLPPLPQ